MPFQPEHKKTGGRKRGVPNKRTTAKLLGIEEYCRQKKYDPLHAMIDIALDANTDPAIRLSCHKEVAQYIYAKRKAVELSGKDSGAIHITFVDKARDRIATKLEGMALRHAEDAPNGHGRTVTSE